MIVRSVMCFTEHGTSDAPRDFCKTRDSIKFTVMLLINTQET